VLAESAAAVISTERESVVGTQRIRGRHKAGLTSVVGDPDHDQLVQVDSQRQAVPTGERTKGAVLAGGETKLNFPAAATRKLHCPPV
jgi:hypothetical protein